MPSGPVRSSALCFSPPAERSPEECVTIYEDVNNLRPRGSHVRQPGSQAPLSQPGNGSREGGHSEQGTQRTQLSSQSGPRHPRSGRGQKEGSRARRLKEGLWVQNCAWQCPYFLQQV